jgi:hypothetical protein
MESRADVREGMVVVSADRQELGRIVRCDELGFTVEKGKLLLQDLDVRYEDVARSAGGQILLTRRRHDYVEASNGEPIVTEDELAQVARGELAPEQIEKTLREVS